ncbi:hypothetical protein C1646_674009 [Rhizophagus diaphanus]|nr:hypothetical protein C1646_674009 [Rhizophagus diaphanus] [Rhizophagus sp. MUCL 43196]
MGFVELVSEKWDVSEMASRFDLPFGIFTAPKVLLTDNDSAISSAYNITFKDAGTNHRLCQWHLAVSILTIYALKKFQEQLIQSSCYKCEEVLVDSERETDNIIRNSQNIKAKGNVRSNKRKKSSIESSAQKTKSKKKYMTNRKNSNKESDLDVMPSYYEPCGAVIIAKTLRRLFIDTKILTKSLASPQTLIEYLQEVLIPKAAVRLIQEDYKRIQVENTREIML